MTTSAMLGMMQTIPESHKQLAPQLVSILTAIGFGLGPFVGGVIAQFSQTPLVTPYLPIILGAVLCFVGLFWLKTPALNANLLVLHRNYCVLNLSIMLYS